jgi:hypothetical protein
LAAWNGSDFVKVATSTADGVTSVGGTGTVNGITLSGTVTSTGDLTLGGTLSGVSLTTQVTGTLPVGNGGTGAATLTANNVLLGNGTSALQVVAPGTTGNLLTSDGTTWTSATPTAQAYPGAGMAVSTGTAWGTSKTTPTGDVVGTSDTQTLTNKTLTAPESTGAIYDNGSVRGNLTAVAALDIDCTAGNYFTKTISANSTFTFSSPPSSRAYAFTLELTHTSGTVTWPTEVQWPGGTAPSLTNAKTSLFVFVTDDGGTRWYGVANTNYTT